MFKFGVRHFCDKRVFITTPIFYVNSKPHIGHLYTAFLASAVKYVNLLKNENSHLIQNFPILSTGTDEHGLKIQQKAKEQKMDPKKLCDENSKVFRDLFKLAKIDYDFFIRTSDDIHKSYVHSFWREMIKKDKISKCDYSGYYSIQDESFVPEKDLIQKDGKFYTNLSVHANLPCEYITEQNYQIKFDQELLTKYKNLIKDQKLKFIPESINNEVNGYINSNLLQLCISRPQKRVNWGIEVPDDPDHTIYVWFEALLNYLTIANEYYKNKLELDKIEFIHIIGKDISKFHCYIWPLILLLNDHFPFKITIIMHNYWLKNATKMSKSIGNVVDPEKIIKKFGVDAIRFYSLSAGPLLNDMSFDEKTMTNVFYRNIPDVFINLILRLSNNKIIDVNNFNKIENFDEDYNKRIEINMKFVESALKELNEYNFIQAAHYVHLILLDLNNLIANSEFWKKTEDIKLINQISCFSLEFIRIISILFYPYLPELMMNVNKFIGNDEKFIKFKFAYFRYKNLIQFNQQNIEDEEIKTFNQLSSTNGYFNINLDYKSKIFVQKIKL